MGERKIQVGQVWKKNDTGESYLVTRLYTEALATFVVLRPTDDEAAKPLRIKVSRATEGMSLPGFTPAQSFETS